MLLLTRISAGSAGNVAGVGGGLESAALTTLGADESVSEEGGPPTNEDRDESRSKGVNIMGCGMWNVHAGLGVFSQSPAVDEGVASHSNVVTVTGNCRRGRGRRRGGKGGGTRGSSSSENELMASTASRDSASVGRRRGFTWKHLFSNSFAGRVIFIVLSR
jgi:hypothetical protein